MLKLCLRFKIHTTTSKYFFEDLKNIFHPKRLRVFSRCLFSSVKNHFTIHKGLIKVEPYNGMLCRP